MLVIKFKVCKAAEAFFVFQQAGWRTAICLVYKYLQTLYLNLLYSVFGNIKQCFYFQELVRMGLYGIVISDSLQICLNMSYSIYNHSGFWLPAWQTYCHWCVKATKHSRI